MIDHTGIIVSNFEQSKSFYALVLASIGLALFGEYPAFITGKTDVAGFFLPLKAKTSMSLAFWISWGTPGACEGFPSWQLCQYCPSRAVRSNFEN